MGDRLGPGRKSRLTEAVRSQIIALAKGPPPGVIVRQSEGTFVSADAQANSHRTLNALVEAAHKWGIRIERSHVRRILRREKVRWRSTHSGGDSTDPDFVPKGPRSSRSMARLQKVADLHTAFEERSTSAR